MEKKESFLKLNPIDRAQSNALLSKKDPRFIETQQSISVEDRFFSEVPSSDNLMGLLKENAFSKERTHENPFSKKVDTLSTKKIGPSSQGSLTEHIFAVERAPR